MITLDYLKSIAIIDNDCKRAINFFFPGFELYSAPIGNLPDQEIIDECLGANLEHDGKYNTWYFNSHDNDGDPFFYIYYIGEEEHVAHIPHYSMKIEDAWLVVEKFVTCNLETVIDENKKITWLCTLGRIDFGFIGDDKAKFGQSRSDSAPMAICLAALKTKGVEI